MSRAAGLRTPARRSVRAFALLAAGMILGRAWADPGATIPLRAWFAGALCAAILGLCARGRWARTGLAIAVLCAGAAWFTLRVAQRPADALARMLTDEPTLVAVEGVVETSPRIASTQRGMLAPFAHNARTVARFDLRVTRVLDASDHPTPASGHLYVRVDGPVAKDAAQRDAIGAALLAGLPRAGTSVRITGLASRVRAPANPGEMDFRPIAAARNIAGSIRCASPELVQPIDPPAGFFARAHCSWIAWKDSMRAGARRVLVASVADEHTTRQALLGALLLGDRASPYDELSAPFVRLGVSHVLAISGLHVAIFVGFVALLVRLPGDHWRLETVAILLAIAIMVVLIPARAPVVRAWAIIAGFAIAGLFGRRYDALSTLGWVACVVLLWRPTELWNPGFQLSFLIVAALIALTGRVRDRTFGLKRDPDHRTGRERLRYYAEDALCASTCAWIIATPIVMHRFGVVAPLAPIVSLLIVPLVGVLLVVGYAAIAIAWLAPGAAAPLGAILNAASAWLLGVVGALDGVPGATFRVPQVGWVWAAGATIALWLVLLRGMGRTRPRRAGTIAILCALAAWPVYLTLGGTPSLGGTPGVSRRGPAPAFTWTAIDVGDGSAHILTSDRHSVMFDCGSNWYGIGQRTIPDAARALGAWRIPTVVISHPDLDHYSGLLDCVEPLGVRTVLVGRAFADEAARLPAGPAAFTLRELERRGVAVRIVGAGDSISFGRARMEFISPPDGFTWEKDNDSSLVALVSVPSAPGAPASSSPTNHESESRLDESRSLQPRLLLCADIEQDATEQVETALRARAITRIDAMTAPHHGSARPFAFDFVESLAPRLVVQSTGPSRLHDERWDSVKATIPDWLITARDGAITTTFAPDGTLRTRVWSHAQPTGSFLAPD